MRALNIYPYKYLYLSIYRDGESGRKTVREGGKEGEGI